MKKIILWLVFICVTYPLFSQKMIVKGVVIDNSTTKPIPFANVYFENNPNIGTYTDTSGYFEVYINNINTLNSKLIVSSLGYQSAFYSKNKSQDIDTIFLSKEVYDLDEISIIPKRYSEIKLKPNKNLKLDYNLLIPQKGVSLQVGTAFMQNKHNGFISKVKLYIKSEKATSSIARLRIYSMTSNTPKKDILKENIIIDLSSSKKYINIDLEKFNIQIDGDFFIAIEFFVPKEESINKGGSTKTTIKFTKCKKEYLKKHITFQKINGSEWKKYEPIKGELFVPYMEVEMKIEN